MLSSCNIIFYNNSILAARMFSDILCYRLSACATANSW